MSKTPPPPSVSLHIPPRTYVMFFLFLATFYVVKKLAPFLLLFFVATLLAITINPLVGWLKKKGMPRGVAIALFALTLAGVAAFFLFIMLPPLFEQISVVAQKVPTMTERAVHLVPEGSKLRGLVDKGVAHVQHIDSGAVAEKVLTGLEMAVGGLTGLFLIVVFTLYLLTDGARSYRWLAAFLSTDNRRKLDRCAGEASEVVFAYVAGQAITSVICGSFTFAVLASLGVPAALALGVLAGVCDILPVVGFFISGIPAILLALTVSPSTALFVLLAYGAYHAIENYLLVPKIYGNKLRLSDLVVILALLVGGTVAGMMGAIVILPIVASYPIFEETWLTKKHVE